MKALASSYLLCNCYMLDSDYNNTVDFNNSNNQLNWFLDKVQFRLDDSMYQRKSELEIRIDKSLNELKLCNYMLVINDDNTKYFYFIVNKEYVNDYTTLCILQLDLIQTYLFHLKQENFRPCLVERMHIKDWITNDGELRPLFIDLLEDEGLDTGEYEVKQINNLYDYESKGSYIITTSEPLGTLTSGETRFDNNSTP